MEYNLHAFLTKLGLTDNELKVYLAVLQNGGLTMGQVADITHINRVVIYATVDNLLKKGFVAVTKNSYGKRVTANSPKQIQAMIDDRRRKARKLELQYEEVLPVLMSLYSKATVRPKVLFFEGKKALDQMSYDIIETMIKLPVKQRIVYSYSNPERLDANFREEIFGDKGYISHRVKNNIFLYAIVPDGVVTQRYTSSPEEQMHEVVALPEEFFPVQNDLSIYHNKIAFQSIGQELIGVMIESQEIAQDQLAFFKLAWEGAKAVAKTKKFSF